MLIKILKEASWHQMAMTLAACIMASIVIQALVKVLLIVWNRNRKLKALAKFDGPTGHWLWGNIKDFQIESMLERFRAYADKYDGAYRIHAGLDYYMIRLTSPENIKAILATAEPKDPRTYGYVVPWIGEGLLISKGNKWFRNRKLLTPGFHFEILKPYVNIFCKSSQIMMDKWKKTMDKESRFEMFEHVSLMTLDSILKCAFGYDSECQLTKSPYIQSVYDISSLVVKRARTLRHHVDFVYYLSDNGRKFRKAVKIAHDYSSRVIRTRKQEVGKGTAEAQIKRKYVDFLDILLQARDEDGQGLTDVEIQAEVDTFLFEGHDTTASGISWCLYNLARHPEHQTRCREEITEVLGDSKQIEWNDLSKMTYLTMCIKESLRLHPPVPGVSRRITKPLTLGDGRVVPAGTWIGIGIYEVHHNPDIWRDPDVYDPMRFTADNSEGRSPHAFVPFSAGPRNCIGQQFAMSEMKTCIAMILRNFEFTWKEDTPVIKMPELILRAKQGLWLNVRYLGE